MIEIFKTFKLSFLKTTKLLFSIVVFSKVRSCHIPELPDYQIPQFNANIKPNTFGYILFGSTIKILKFGSKDNDAQNYLTKATNIFIPLGRFFVNMFCLDLYPLF